MPRPESWPRAAVVAAAAFAAGLGLRLLLLPLLSTQFAFMFFFPAIGAAAWFGGRRAGLLTTIYSALSVWYWWLPVYGSFILADVHLAFHLLAYLLIGGSGAYLIAEGKAAVDALRVAQAREAALRQDYEVTLRSIGDAVIATDATARITFMNAAAEALTGWSFAAVQGTYVDTVFTVVTEENGEPVPSPVRRALAERRPIGLQNHTLLLDRHGRALPVAHSAAPIFEGSHLRGVVLVFHDVVEQTNARRALEAANSALAQQVTDLRQLQELSRKIFTAAGFESMLEEVLRAALEVNRTEKGLLSLVASEREGLAVAASRGFPPEFLQRIDFVPQGAGACGRCFLKRQRVVIEDVQTDAGFEEYRDAAQIGGFRAVHSTPLITREGKLIGVLSVHFSHPHRPGEREMRLMDVYARNAADLIENAQLREQLQRELQAHKATAAELARANRELEQRVQERTASLTDLLSQMETFSYTVSHDLRSPLRAMGGYAEVLRDTYGPQLDNEGRDLIGRIIGGSQRLNRLIVEVLRYTKVNRERLTLEPVSLREVIAAVVQHALELQEPRATVVIPEHMAPVIGSETFLTQVFANVLGNAVKFVPEGRHPRVEITCEQRGQFVRIVVADNGIGIPPELQPRLFGLFERLSSDRRFEGIGMGLAIVRRAVERMGGKVGVESDGRSGTRFWIDLHAAPAPSTPPPRQEVAAVAST